MTRLLLAFSQIEMWCLPEQMRHALTWEQFFAKLLQCKQIKKWSSSFNKFLSLLKLASMSVSTPQLALGSPCLQKVQVTDPSDWLIRAEADENSLLFLDGTEKGFFEVGGSVGFVPIGLHRSLACKHPSLILVDQRPLKLWSAHSEVIFPWAGASKVIQSLFPGLVKLERVLQLDHKESVDFSNHCPRLQLILSLILPCEHLRLAKSFL